MKMKRCKFGFFHFLYLRTPLSSSGYTFEQILSGIEKGKPGWKELLSVTDILVDGKFILEEKSLNILFRGSKNQRLIDVKKSLEKGEPVLWDPETESGVARYTV